MLKFGFILLLFVSSNTCISNSTFESLKKGILPFNNAGNNFFNLIRGDVNHSLIGLEDFQHWNLSFDSMKKVTSAYLSHSILLAIGVTFAVLLPIVGFFFCLCRCCGRCGGKVKPMDPRNVKCKKALYAMMLTILVIGMMFAVIITLFNNQIVHESITNSDPSINIFLNAKSQSDKMKSVLESMRKEIAKSDPSKIDNQDLQPVIKELEGAIRTFFDAFMNTPKVLDLIDQSRLIIQVIDQPEGDNYQQYLKGVNQLLRYLNSDLGNIKATIFQKLSSCTSPQCEDVKRRTNILAIQTIDEDKIKNITDVFDYLNKTEFKERLEKMVGMKNNGVVDTKLILDKEISYVKDRINDKSFSESVKNELIKVIDKILELRDKLAQYIPLPLKNESAQYEYFKSAKSVEQYRYYIYIGLSSGITLIIVFYLLGLLYGNCGERPEEDAGCFNRGVGANFLMISITLTFLLSSLVMIVVLSHIMTTNLVQTDFCRYTIAPFKENSDPRASLLIDRYLQVALNIAAKDQSMPDGVMEALFRKCEKENFYTAFSKINNHYLLKSLQSHFDAIDEKIVTNLANQLNLSKYLMTDPLTSVSSVDFDRMTNSITLSMDDGALNAYLSDLINLSVDMKNEQSSLRSVVVKVTRIQSHMRVIFQKLIIIQNQYVKWKSIAVNFNDNRINLIKTQSPSIIKNIQMNLLPVLNLLFGTMFANVSCTHFRETTMNMLNGLCENVVDPINGCWYGLGFFLLLVIPALIFACFLVSLYRRIQKFYPDKDEPDYENYIGFYARADGEAFKNKGLQNNNNNKSPHRGYKPIPLQ